MNRHAPTRSGPKPRAAIVYLTRRDPLRRIYLHTSLYYLFKHFNATHQYPVIICHQGDFDLAAQEYTRALLPPVLRPLLQFQKLDSDDFRAPRYARARLVRAHRGIVPDARDIGYRTMCRWWTMCLPKYVGDYDYYMRLDDDSFIEQPLRDDLFQLVADASVDYASNLIHVEHPLNAIGLEAFASQHLASASRVSALCVRGPTSAIANQKHLATFVATLPNTLRQLIDLRELSGPIIYYNNWHIARTTVWRRHDIASFFGAVDDSGGTYYLRWGDAALQTIAVVACEGLRLGRFTFAYSKRYEREQGAYVNTDHTFAQRFMGPLRTTGTTLLQRTGSMTDFPAFNDHLSRSGLSDMARDLEGGSDPTPSKDTCHAE